MDAEPRWLTFDEVFKIQEMQISFFGGTSGVLDLGLVESAIDNPKNLWHHDERDLVTLAVRVCMAIARNHGFQDGNKRTGWASLLVFLELNGFQLVMTNDITPALWVEACLVRKTSEEELAEFLAPHIVAIDNAILAAEHEESQPDLKT